MDALIPAAVGVAALALLFLLLAMKSWRSDRQKRQDAINERLRR